MATYVVSVNIGRMPIPPQVPPVPKSPRKPLVPILITGAIALSLLAPNRANAQQTSPAREALATCTSLAEARNFPQAAVTGKLAQEHFESALARAPKDADLMVGLARALTQCILPTADLAGQGDLSGRAIELLQNALDVDPRHFTARFVLANIYLQSPSFLGRAPLAAKEFDTLLEQMGDRTDNARYARVFELRGKMFARSKMEDSARALFARGHKLFPADSALAALAPVSPSPAPESPTASASLATVRVVASANAPAAAAPSVQQLNRSKILMTAGGTADVMQAVQTQAGATRVAEGSDVYTRGGGASETALLVDGGRVPSLSRFEGLNGGMFGALDPFIVKNVRYSSGGFSAKHGNALSGVLEVETDGRPREREMRAGLSMAQGSFTIRAPINRKVGVWASGRLANSGVILATHGRTAEFASSPHSEDLIASVSANPSATSELRATVIAEQDDSRRIVNAAGWEGPFHSNGGARSLLLSSRWMPGDARIIVRNSVAASSRSSVWNFGVLERDRADRNLVARSDLEWAPQPELIVRGGVEHGRFSRVETGRVPTTNAVSDGAPSRTLDGDADGTTHLGAYSEAQLSRASTSLLVGLRADRLPGETDITIDPRASLSTRRGAWTARVGGGVFHQGRWQSAPAIPDAGSPAGAPRVASHIIAGIEHEGITTFRLEAYDKRYGDYATLGAGPPIEHASARGVDVIAQRALGGRFTGWASYSLLSAQLQLVDGREARSPYDITHTGTASVTATLTPSWSVGTTARYGTGAPLTPVVNATRSTSGAYTPVYGSVTSERLPAYARLDMRVMHFARTPSYLLTSFLEVINATDRANVSSVTYDATFRNRVAMHSFFATRTLVAGAEVQRR
jgi:hypothetical protein